MKRIDEHGRVVLSGNDIPEECSFLRCKQEENYYGSYNRDGSDAWDVEYVSHNYFSGNEDDAAWDNEYPLRDEMWTVARWNNFSSESETAYYKYITDPDLSPWKDLLAVLQYTLTENEDKGLTGIIVHNHSINRYILMHFLKAFRQPAEGATYEYFHSVQKSHPKDEKRIYEAFLISSYVSGSKDTVYFQWEHDHRCWKVEINQNILEKKISGNMNSKKMTENPDYTDGSMGYSVFGANKMSITKRDLSVLMTTPPIRGYFFSPLDYDDTSYSFPISSIAKRHDDIFAVLCGADVSDHLEKKVVKPKAKKREKAKPVKINLDIGIIGERQVQF